jgi:hypothetical protein
VLSVDPGIHIFRLHEGISMVGIIFSGRTKMRAKTESVPGLALSEPAIEHIFNAV